ncbi:MAG: DNA-deoxyinosine glycosylase [Clostridiales bacterium]|nr:DNA-deoxyinosine glycosylase [Clostridiales bacterium]
MEQQLIHVKHGFEPVYDNHSRILILGSFPSVKSREQKFYYGHPQNRFWRVMEALLNEEAMQSTEDKKAMLLRHGIAVWDVIDECDIRGSSDSSIKNVITTDLSVILNDSPIEKIFANGNKAFELYMKYSYPVYQREIIRLPSTSPANAAYNPERLIKEWQKCISCYLL